jgi:hypothetical protein
MDSDTESKVSVNVRPYVKKCIVIFFKIVANTGVTSTYTSVLNEFLSSSVINLFFQHLILPNSSQHSKCKLHS